MLSAPRGGTTAASWKTTYSTIEGTQQADVSVGAPSVSRDIPVTYVPLNYGPTNKSYELWHYGPVFTGKPNVVLIHGIQLKTSVPLIGTLGGGDVCGQPDEKFNLLDDLLQKKSNGQRNAWQFEYGDTLVSGSSRYWTHGSITTYGSRLAAATTKALSLNLEDGRVDLIAHSMGGLISRYAAQNYGRVEKLITLDTGHFGFEYTKFGIHLTSVPQCVIDMQPGSPFLWNLNNGFVAGRFKVLSIAAGDVGMAGGDAVSETSARLVECGLNGSVKSKASTYFVVASGTGHASVKNVTSESHVAFKLIKPFLATGAIPAGYRTTPTGTPYFTFVFRYAPVKGYPVVILPSGARVNATAMFNAPFRINEVNVPAWTLRAGANEQGTMKIYWAPHHYVNGTLTRGQSAIMKGVVNNAPTPLKETAITPANGATNVPAASTVVLTFNEPIQLGGNASRIALSNVATGMPVSVTKRISGNRLTLDPVADLPLGTTYRVTVPPHGVVGETGGTLGSTYTATFTTVKKPTSMTISTSPTAPKLNVAFTVSGTLKSGTTGLVGFSVHLERKIGTGTWTDVTGSAKTTTAGGGIPSVSQTMTQHTTYSYRWHFTGTGTYKPCYSPVKTFTV